MGCDRDKVTSEAGLLNVLGALYASVLFFAVINALIVQPVLSAERAVSYRERAAGMYSFWPWTLALVYLLKHANLIVHASPHSNAILVQESRVRANYARYEQRNLKCSTSDAHARCVCIMLQPNTAAI